MIVTGITGSIVNYSRRNEAEKFYCRSFDGEVQLGKGGLESMVEEV